jgi:hypothetical protein
MALGDVEPGEVEIVGLDVGAFRDREAHVGEDRGQLVDHLADRMDAALIRRRLAHRQRDVDGLGVEARVERGVLERVAARGERRRDFILEPVDQRPLHAALARRYRAKRLEQRGDRAVAAERGDTHGFQRRLVGRGRDVGLDLLLEASDVGHGFRLSRFVMPGLVPGIHVFCCSKQDVDGRDKPGHDDDGVAVGQLSDYAAAGNEAFAFSTIAWKAAGSVIARSDSTLRSTIKPDLFSPSINRL